MKNALCVLAAFAAMVMFASQAAAGDETHEGKVMSVVDGKLTMCDKDGKNEHSHMITSEAAVTCDGKDCKIDDLTKDCWVKVTCEKRGDVKVVTKVEAKKAKQKR
jgi:hypothetical protein